MSIGKTVGRAVPYDYVVFEPSVAAFGANLEDLDFEYGTDYREVGFSHASEAEWMNDAARILRYDMHNYLGISVSTYPCWHPLKLIMDDAVSAEAKLKKFTRGFYVTVANMEQANTLKAAVDSAILRHNLTRDASSVLYPVSDVVLYPMVMVSTVGNCMHRSRVNELLISYIASGKKPHSVYNRPLSELVLGRLTWYLSDTESYPDLWNAGNGYGETEQERFSDLVSSFSNGAYSALYEAGYGMFDVWAAEDIIRIWNAIAATDDHPTCTAPIAHTLALYDEVGANPCSKEHVTKATLAALAFMKLFSLPPRYADEDSPQTADTVLKSFWQYSLLAPNSKTFCARDEHTIHPLMAYDAYRVWARMADYKALSVREFIALFLRVSRFDATTRRFILPTPSDVQKVIDETEIKSRYKAPAKRPNNMSLVQTKTASSS